MTRDLLGPVLQTAVVFLLGGGLVALLLLPQQRRKLSSDAKKLDADAMAIVTGAAGDWAQQVLAEAKDAKREAAAATSRVRQLEEHIVRQNEVMRAAGLPVSPIPPLIPPREER